MDDYPHTGELARLHAGLIARGIEILSPDRNALVTGVLSVIDQLMAAAEPKPDSAFPDSHAQMKRFLDMHGYTQPAYISEPRSFTETES